MTKNRTGARSTLLLTLVLLMTSVSFSPFGRTSSNTHILTSSETYWVLIKRFIKPLAHYDHRNWTILYAWKIQILYILIYMKDENNIKMTQYTMKWRKLEGIRSNELSSDASPTATSDDGYPRFRTICMILSGFLEGMRHSGEDKREKEWEGEEGRRKIEKSEERIRMEDRRLREVTRYRERHVRVVTVMLSIL